MFTLPVTTEFFFIRHGQTDWNAEKRLQGSTDIPLNAQGREQAETAKYLFQNISINHIFSSNLSRAYETATIINSTLNTNISSHTGLQERYFGILEGLSPLEIAAQPPEKIFYDEIEANGFKRALHSEALPDFDQRVVDTIKNILHAHMDNTLLFVSHGGVFASLCRQLLQQTIHSDNAVPYRFFLSADGWNLEKIG